nr:conserved hypothetical protein [Albugo laibachii Nc14]|eukprot:CCA16316.1 conserved hypothetical protein [Albugo laibachii Nc14]
MKLSTLIKLTLAAVAAVASLSSTDASSLSGLDENLPHHRNLASLTDRDLKAKDAAPKSEEVANKGVDDETNSDDVEGDEDEEEEAAEAEGKDTEPPKKKKKKVAPATKAAEKKEPAKKEVKKEVKKNVKKDANKTKAKKPVVKKSTKEEAEVVEEAGPWTGSKKDKTKKDNERIKGFKREGIIDDFADGAAEIDKINVNPDGWVSILSNTPDRLIRASLYAFLSYNDSAICTNFNMTFTTLEQKEIPDGNLSHAVVYVNCTLNGVEETPGKFVLNFVPEGDRLLLTECGHREAGEIVNWLMIKDQVPQCMTPNQRRDYLTQPLKHIKTPEDEIALASGKANASTTNFFAQIRNIDTEEAAILGSATFALISIIVIIAIFIARKRKAQLDLERTIAGAKVEKAAEDDPTTDTDTETTGTVERKGLMDTAKANSSTGDAGVEEGSFVNSPAIKIEIK